MRRRRRQATQIIKKKGTITKQSPYIQYPSQSSMIWKRIFRIFLFIIIFGGIGYILYNINYESELTQEIPIDTTSTVSESHTEEIPLANIAPFEQRVQIEILNGCGVNGVAKIFESYLRRHGFDVVNTENYREKGKVRWNVRESKVIDQIGKLDQAKDVARSLGISDKNIDSKVNPSAIYDVSVVIGLDFKKLKAVQ